MSKAFDSIKSRLARRVIIYVILTSTIVTVFTSGIQVYSEYKRDIDELHEEINQIEQTHLLNITSRLWVLDTKELQTTLNSLLSLPSIQYLAVYDNETLFMAAGEDTDKNVIVKHYPLVYNFNNRNRIIGTLVVKVTLADTYRHIFERIAVIITSNAIKTFIVSGLLFVIFYQLVIRHIRNIAGFAEQTNINTLDQKFEFDRKQSLAGHEDELDLLRNSLATMQKNLNSATQDLQKREQRLAITLNSIGDAVISVDKLGNIIHMNPVAEKLSGQSLGDVNGRSIKSVFSILNTRTREPVELPVEKVVTSGNTVFLRSDVTLRSENGAEFQITISMAPMRYAGGDIHGMVLVLNDISEEFHLRETAAKNKRNLEAFMDHSPAVIYMKDIDGRYMFINKHCENIFKANRKNVIGNTDYDIFEKTIADSFRNNDTIVLETGRALETEEVAPHGDDYHTYVSVKFPLFDDHHRVFAICGISTDITEQKKILQALRLSEEHYRTLLENLPGVAYQSEYDASRSMLFINTNIIDLSGYPATDFIGNTVRSFTSLIFPDDVKVVSERVSESIKNKQAYTLEYRIIHQDGSIRWVFEKGQGIFDTKGKLKYLDGVILDISAEHQAREELSRKEYEQQNILDSIVDPVITINQDGAILTFNKPAEVLFGYTSDEIIGRPVSVLMPGTFASEHDDSLKRYLETGDAHIMGNGRVVEGKTKDDNIFPMWLTVAELPKNSDGSRRFIGSCVDLTLLKLQEEQLRRTKKMDALGKLVGGVAHDYNNLLGIILGYVELTQNMLEKKSELYRFTEEIRHAAERGAKLTNRLLAFSKQKTQHSEVLDINTLIHNISLMLERTITARIKILYEFAEDLWPICVDKSDFEDTVLNICINAMHAIPGNGKIVISTCNRRVTMEETLMTQLAAGDYSVLAISDNGCGMDETTREKIFEPFFTTKGDQGTGLGMSQVYGFVERSNGTINIDSKPGQGTRISLYFPRFRKPRDENKAAETGTDILKNPGGNECILVVDDEPSLLSLACNILSMQGYKTMSALSGKQALEILAHNRVNLLLADIIMPEMDGLKLAEIVQRQYPNVKIQLVSGFSSEAHTSGANRHLLKNLLQKPYSTQTLSQTIRKRLDS